MIDIDAFYGICRDVLNETARQNDKWGKQDFTPLKWLPILAEEFGEVARVVCEMYHGHRQGIVTPRVREYHEGLIKVASVAIMMIKKDREQLSKTESV